jgi:hypothetical protein
MSTLPGPQNIKQQRKNTLRMFYVINHEATSFAFVGSLLLTLAVGILERLGFLSGASLLVPALMIALWSIGLILFSWRYQQ